MPAPRPVPREPPAAAPAWHALPAGDVEQALSTSPGGLTAAEVADRQARFGPNQLEDQPPTPRIVVLARQFRSPLIFILLGAAAVTLALGEHIDTAVIAAVLVLNATIGFTQERKAEGAVRALMQLVVPHARVVRDGQEWEIDSRLLVPGDVVLLEPGSKVPADLRLVHVSSLQVDESLLTGESAPVTKSSGPVEEGVPLADRRSMAYTGAVVTSGRGRGVVVATGAATELGAIADLVREEGDGETPLQARIGRFAKVIGLAVALAASVAFVSGVLRGGETDDMFLTAVALAVSAVPEGLPVAVTITLAIGVSRMARRRAVVRRLPAVETLGSTTVIGSDKTGTLTENRMRVDAAWTAAAVHELAGPPAGHDPLLHRLLLAGVLTNEAEAYRSEEGITSTGDPTEVALLVAAMACGIEPDVAREERPSLAEIPFEPERRYSASVRQDPGGDVPGGHVTYVKGAPERVIEMCTHLLTPDGPVPLDPAVVHDAARALASRGLRVLAMAEAPATPPAPAAEVPEPDGLVLLGLQGMLDPPRAGVADAVAACHTAGVRVLMITGDHAITARAIASDLGIATADDPVLTGAEMQHLDDEDLRARVGEVSVYARVAPDEKLRIVRALQDLGEVVAVTGDGVNDAPALKAAAIGVAMGRSGTDVAREASDMVLADDDFVTITAAVEEGRVTFDNIRKVTFFLVSTGAAEVAAILVAVWLGWPLLLLPAQLLWLNLVTNGLQDVALAFEPGDPKVLRRPPRPPSEGILSRFTWQRTALAGLVMAAGTLAMFRWALDRSDSLVQAQSVALTTLVVFQAFQAGNARSEHRSIFRVSPTSNRFLLLATLAALSVHVAALYLPPTRYVLRIEPIDLLTWLLIAAVGSTVVVASEVQKLVSRGRRRD